MTITFQKISRGSPLPPTDKPCFHSRPACNGFIQILNGSWWNVIGGLTGVDVQVGCFCFSTAGTFQAKIFSLTFKNQYTLRFYFFLQHLLFPLFFQILIRNYLFENSSLCQVTSNDNSVWVTNRISPFVYSNKTSLKGNFDLLIEIGNINLDFFGKNLGKVIIDLT